MRADISRITFDRRRHLAAVVKQQGRVDLDADWNEQRDIDRHLSTTSLTDVIGPSGAPIDDDAFAITAAGADITLSAGRYYLGGVMLENDAEVSLFAQPDLPSAGPFVRRTDGTWVEPPGVAPAGVYAAWLTTWPQHRSVVEQPDLREVALNGPDTTTRSRTVWQVRLLQAGAPGDSFGCADEPPGWDQLTAPSTGTLAAFADPSGVPANDCTIPMGSPYRGLDNQLYRVEIHDGGLPGTATYVWSRDNGSIVVAWESTDADTITVTSPGRKGSDGFTSGCWIELTDDRHEQLGMPGTLVQVDRAEGDRLVLKPGTATGSTDHADFSGRPRARRWDGQGDVPADGSDVPLELGITVRFSAVAADTYRTGDYWAFPARAATHTVEWPETGGNPDAVTPHGPFSGHARIAILGFDGANWSLIDDCRPLFAPLVDQLALSYVSGDTQSALPDIANPAALIPLAHGLVVGVANGGRPITGARIRFTVTTGTGRLGGPAGGSEVTVTTAADGLAAALWEVDSTTVVPTVDATLLADDGTARGLPVQFSARLARADGVAYDPVASPTLAGAVTVQQAIDRLAANGHGGCDTISVTPGSDWAAALEGLASGADATICFQPGEYTTTRAVTIAGLRHVRLSGAGAGTRLIGTGTESVLTFEGCTTVTVRDLSASISAYPTTSTAGLLGVVTVIGAAEVQVERVRLACPGDASSRAACLTVRTGGDALGDAASDSVRVRDCEFSVGHAQSGVLVVNSRRVAVSGSHFETVQAGTLNLDVLLGNKVRLSKLINQLTGKLVIERDEGIVRGDFNTALRVKDFVVRLNSPVPEREWRTLMAANPPTDADAASAQAVTAYFDGLVNQVVDAPTTLPTFGRQVTGLRGRLGSVADNFLASAEGQTSVRALLSGTAVDVKPVSEVQTVQRAISLPAAGGTVRFDSPLPQSQWEAALAAVPIRDQSPSGVAKHARAVLGRALRDAAFANQVMPGLFDSLAARNPDVAACGVRVGGHTVGEVVVERNRMVATAEGVHIGTSFRRGPGQPGQSAESVRIEGNHFELRVPVEVEVAPRGIFVGNVGRVVVKDNVVRVSGGASRAGVHIEGRLGIHLLVRDNTLMSCQFGVLVLDHSGTLLFVPKRLWLVADNIMPFSDPAVVAPEFTRIEGNVS